MRVFAFKSLGKGLKREEKNIVLQKLTIGGKNTEFHADFESVEKVGKQFMQKCYKNLQKLDGNMHFFIFSHGHQTGLLITLFGTFFEHFSTDLKSA